MSTNQEAYVQQVYNYLRQDTVGLDAVYEDHIIEMVGRYGLHSLREYKLIEPCGVVNGRQLYVLCCEKES